MAFLYHIKLNPTLPRSYPDAPFADPKAYQWERERHPETMPQHDRLKNIYPMDQVNPLKTGSRVANVVENEWQRAKWGKGLLYNGKGYFWATDQQGDPHHSTYASNNNLLEALYDGIQLLIKPNGEVDLYSHPTEDDKARVKKQLDLFGDSWPQYMKLGNIGNYYLDNKIDDPYVLPNADEWLFNEAHVKNAVRVVQTPEGVKGVGNERIMNRRPIIWDTDTQTVYVGRPGWYHKAIEDTYDILDYGLMYGWIGESESGQANHWGEIGWYNHAIPDQNEMDQIHLALEREMGIKTTPVADDWRFGQATHEDDEDEEFDEDEYLELEGWLNPHKTLDQNEPLRHVDHPMPAGEHYEKNDPDSPYYHPDDEQPELAERPVLFDGKRFYAGKPNSYHWDMINHDPDLQKAFNTEQYMDGNPLEAVKDKTSLAYGRWNPEQESIVWVNKGKFRRDHLDELSSQAFGHPYDESEDMGIEDNEWTFSKVADSQPITPPGFTPWGKGKPGKGYVNNGQVYAWDTSKVKGTHHYDAWEAVNNELVGRSMPKDFHAFHIHGDELRPSMADPFEIDRAIAALGIPKKTNDTWMFSKTARQSVEEMNEQPWKKGEWGKAIVFKDGEVRHWSTDKGYSRQVVDGMPAHYMMDDGESYKNYSCFVINPEGQVSKLSGWAGPQVVADAIGGTVEPSGGYFDWTFSKVATTIQHVTESTQDPDYRGGDSSYGPSNRRPVLYHTKSDTAFIGPHDSHHDTLYPALEDHHPQWDPYDTFSGIIYQPRGQENPKLKWFDDGESRAFPHKADSVIRGDKIHKMEDHEIKAFEQGYEPDAKDDDWTFSHTATAEDDWAYIPDNWMPGSYGKGIIQDGQIKAWKVNDEGTPHHIEMPASTVYPRTTIGIDPKGMVMQAWEGGLQQEDRPLIEERGLTFPVNHEGDDSYDPYSPDLWVFSAQELTVRHHGDGTFDPEDFSGHYDERAHSIDVGTNDLHHMDILHAGNAIPFWSYNGRLESYGEPTWLNSISDWLDKTYPQNNVQVGPREVEDWRFGSSVTEDLSNSIPWYHMAPTQDRARIKAHGLRASTPSLRTPWLQNANNTNGVYVMPSQYDAQKLYKDPEAEGSFAFPHDIWEVKHHEFPQEDGDSQHWVFPHSIPSEQIKLHTPWEYNDLRNSASAQPWTMKPWELGNRGKAMILDDGSVRHWTTTEGFDGDPTHAEYAEAHGIGADVDEPGYYAAGWITPEGKVSSWGYTGPDRKRDESDYPEHIRKFQEISGVEGITKDWTFSKVARGEVWNYDPEDIRPWTPGGNGKFMVEPDGKVHHWATDSTGGPHHFIYAEDFLGQGQVEVAEVPKGWLQGWITRDGEIDAHGPEHLIPFAEKEIGKYNAGDNWTFSHTAFTAPKVTPTPNHPHPVHNPGRGDDFGKSNPKVTKQAAISKEPCNPIEELKAFVSGFGKLPESAISVHGAVEPQSKHFKEHERKDKKELEQSKPERLNRSAAIRFKPWTPGFAGRAILMNDGDIYTWNCGEEKPGNLSDPDYFHDEYMMAKAIDFDQVRDLNYIYPEGTSDSPEVADLIKGEIVDERWTFSKTASWNVPEGYKEPIDEQWKGLTLKDGRKYHWDSSPNNTNHADVMIDHNMDPNNVEEYHDGSDYDWENEGPRSVEDQEFYIQMTKNFRDRTPDWKFSGPPNLTIQEGETRADNEPEEGYEDSDFLDHEGYGKWAWIEGMDPQYWQDAEHGYNGYDDDIEGDHHIDANGYGGYLQPEDSDDRFYDTVKPHHDMIQEMAEKHPKLKGLFADNPAWQYQTDITKRMDDSGVKYALGLHGPDGATLYLKSPHAEHHEVSTAIATPIGDDMTDEGRGNAYGVVQQNNNWTFSNKQGGNFNKWIFHEGETTPEHSEWKEITDKDPRNFGQRQPYLFNDKEVYIGQPGTHHDDLQMDFGLDDLAWGQVQPNGKHFGPTGSHDMRDRINEYLGLPRYQREDENDNWTFSKVGKLDGIADAYFVVRDGFATNAYDAKGGVTGRGLEPWKDKLDKLGIKIVDNADTDWRFGCADEQDWRFSNAKIHNLSDAKNWKKGKDGKFIVTPNGEVHAWQDGKKGYPHHHDYASEHLNELGQEISSGSVRGWLYDDNTYEATGPDHLKALVEEHMGIKPNPGGWSFEAKSPFTL